MTGTPSSADVTHAVGDALGDVGHVISWISVLDWVLIGLAVMLLAWAWLRAAAFARLGTITIDDFKADDTSVPRAEIKAELQRQLGDRGLLPSSGVPSGSPTKANISAAVAAAPAAQAAWLGALINLIPTPPTSTSFRLSGTLLTKVGKPGEVRLDYQLVCQGPRVSVELKHEAGAGWSSVIEAAAIDIYLLIAQAAPDIYPPWARWSSRGALSQFANGLAAEQPSGASTSESSAVLERYDRAIARYRLASELDPENMLARLRAANCLERSASELWGVERTTKFIDALEAYVSVRLRQPTIFSAGYRASVLLSTLASVLRSNVADDVGSMPDCAKKRLYVVLQRLDAERFESDLPITSERYPPALAVRVGWAAARESYWARSRLRPLWTVFHERRFRHRFEPTGRQRRQLRKALGISRMSIRVRKRGARLSNLTQLVWRGWVVGRYLLGRSNLAGWQAHYNAACFYALLPQASPGKSATYDEKRTARTLGRRSLTHLGRAIDQADGELACRWVRDEDPDLEALRSYHGAAFRRVLGRLCPAELIIHFLPRTFDPVWRLCVSGDALAPTGVQQLRPSPLCGSPDSEQVFRVRIFDENKPLVIAAHPAQQGSEQNWKVIPIRVSFEVWLKADERDPYTLPPADWPTEPSRPLSRCQVSWLAPDVQIRNHGAHLV